MDFGSGVPECTGKLRFVSTKFELWKPKIFKYVCCLFFILLGCFFREQLLSSYLRQLSFIFPKFWEFETFSLPSFCIFRHPCRYSPFIFFSSLFDLVLAKIWIRLRHAHNRTTWWSKDPNAESLMRVGIPAVKIIKTLTRSKSNNVIPGLKTNRVGLKSTAKICNPADCRTSLKNSLL